MKMTPRQKVYSRLKSKHGIDLAARENYWKSESEKLKKEIEAHETEMKRKKEMGEEFGGMVGGSPVVNNVGDGNIAGLGIGPKGEPGVHPKKKKAVIPFGMFTRKKPQL